MNIRDNILLRVYLAFGLIVLLAVAVFVRLCDVQFVEGHKWRAMADSLSTKYINIEAARGNIYSNDGSLLATSIPEYELRMDLYAGGIDDDKVFYSKVDSLALRLSQFFKDKSPKEYSRYLRVARKDSVRYLLIKRKIGYQELKTIRTFPLYNIGKHSGGLIAVQQNKRIRPFQFLAARTIGYKNDHVGVGLEGAFGNYIDGESGKRLVQRIAGGVWMPVNDEAEVAPKEGADIISTIDINMQDLVQNALEKQLKVSDADHGTVVLMEVNTGEVRAVANYSRVKEGVYEEKFNYAIAGSQDPGSTFKLASYMALLEDKKVDTNTMVATGDGTYRLPGGHPIRDSHGGIGTVTVMKAFEQSANTAVAKLVNMHYQDNPSQFTDHLYDIHMNERLGLQIPGETKPVIKNPSFKSWNKNMTLPQMAYGYEMLITPLQMLAFYNAVANDGKYIAPLFVKEIRRLGNPIEQYQARVISKQICSEKTIKKLQAMLESVVTKGTGKLMGSPLYRVAGKTGTAQVADGKRGYGKKVYQASFCGYFPADKPKYSIIVSINGPKNGYYGATVAGPVFKEIADRIYASDMQMYNNVSDHLVGNTQNPEAKAGQSKAVKQVYNSLGVKALYAAKSAYFNSVDTNNGVAYQDYNLVKGEMPDVNGMGLKDALYLLGNAGLKTSVSGSGKVVSQSIPSGSRIGKGLLVQLELR